MRTLSASTPVIASCLSTAPATPPKSRSANAPAFWPEVHAPVTTNQLAERLRGAHAIVLHEDATTPITDVEFPTDETLYVLVGPEGGIGQDELDLLGAQSVRLGPQVLRTASAGFAALCAIGALTSRW